MVHAQADLFEAAATLPEGLIYRDDLISRGEELELAARMVELEFQPFRFRGVEGRRRVVSFGCLYDFSAQRLRAGEPLPDFLLSLCARAASFAAAPAEAFAQVLINEYQPGAPIGWHRDRAVFADVVGVSLLAPCLLRFRRRRLEGWERLSVPLAPRSAYLLRGAARNEWEHSIAPARDLRYSITFRSLKTAERP